jgi:hypothetical protein
VKQYNVLHDKLKPYKDSLTKNCKEIRFSHSGHMWAAASSLSVIIFDTVSTNQLAVFTGHTGSIKRWVLFWAVPVHLQNLVSKSNGVLQVDVGSWR